jgi:hypothetical protein
VCAPHFASITLADGVNIKELANYLGHGNPGLHPHVAVIP